MAVWNSSSLGFSDLNGSRHSSGLLKNLTERISKQHLSEHKMFGSKRGKTGSDLKIGKLFRRKGKGTGQQPNSSPRPGKNMKYGGNVDSSSISPSTKEFDRMMSTIGGKSSKGFGGAGKRLFQRKSFG
jgi:hypothetical protein